MLRAVHTDVGAFSRALQPGHRLRKYQLEPARAIVDSVRRGGGDGFAIVFSRQAGKDEMLAQTLAYLMTLYRLRGGSIVVASPTLEPQGMISRARLVNKLDNPLTRGLLRTRDNTVLAGKAGCAFLSAAPGANARGSTASLLLVCNEAQDVEPDRWDAVFDPMAASTDATTVFMGTVWNEHTLLARQMRYYRGLEERDGRRRVFLVPWERVAQDVPAYGDRVRARIMQLGRDHPFIKTEYFLEELNGEAGLFPPTVRERMRGDHAPLRVAAPNRTYALLVDVGGEEHNQWSAGAPSAEWSAGAPSAEWSAGAPSAEWGAGTSASGFEPHARRDATALTVVEIDLASLADPALLAPVYRVVSRKAWTGAGQPELLDEILRLALEVWRPRKIVVDATGIGAGLAAFLERSLGPRVVIPFVFTGASKSELGWDFLNLCSAGRFLDHEPDGSAEQGLFWRQVGACGHEILPGPGRRMRWEVKGRTHDDLLVSAALCSVLDRVDWRDRVARGRTAE